MNPLLARWKKLRAFSALLVAGLLSSDFSPVVHAAEPSRGEALSDHKVAHLPAPQGKPKGLSGFTRIEAAETGIRFTNKLSAILAAQNQILLNGSGVAAGDFDRDGRCDLYFCSLTSGNRLYRSGGDFHFEDVTAKAGVLCEGQFSTGTVMADLDADGWPDLLVNSIGGGTRFFRNRGDGTFEEKPNSGFKRTGGAHSIALADIDGDGDLDVYVANYRVSTVRDQPIRLRLKQVDGKLVVPSPYEDRFLVQLGPGGRGSLIELGEPDILYLNDGHGKFVATDWLGGRWLDTSGKKIALPPRDWGLTALFCDLDGDLKPDLYVCNDFSSPDRIWLNQGSGNFREAPASMFRHTSWASMAVDVADIDRDGRMDLFVSDMTSQDLAKRQTQRGNAHPSVQSEDVDWDRPQYLRNMLHWNAGDGSFREIALMAGVEASEWTWGVAFLDVDLDGYEDLILGNGHAFDMQDSDATERIGRLKSEKTPTTAETLMAQFPTLHTRNVSFRNKGDLTFEPSGDSWDFNREGITHSVILVDLDNDGDMDVVTTDLNQAPGIYRNESTAPRVVVQLQGAAGNPEGVGAEIRLSGPGLTQIQGIRAGGRYLGGDQLKRTFAFPWPTNVQASLEVRWPGGAISSIQSVHSQESLSITMPKPAASQLSETKPEPLPHPILKRMDVSIPERRPDSSAQPSQEGQAQQLIPFNPIESKTLLAVWPGVTAGSLDLMFCRADARQLEYFTRNPEGQWKVLQLPSELSRLPGKVTALRAFPNESSKAAHATARFLVAILQPSSESGGSTAPESVIWDYQRTGQVWSKSIVAEHLTIVVGAFAFADVDHDGKQDVFVAGRSRINRYPEAAPSSWYRQTVTGWARESFGMEGSEMGLATSAETGDLNGDGDADLVVACEWGTPRIWIHQRGGFKEVTHEWGIHSPAWNGLWSSVLLADLDEDQVPEIVLGNAGPNHPWNRFLTPHPMRLYFADWDQSGSSAWSCIEAARPAQRSEYYALLDLETLRARIPALGQRFESNDQYANTPISAWPGVAEGTTRWLELGTLRHMIISRKNGKTQFHELPRESQMTNIRALTVGDFNGDGHPDLLLGQNGGGPLNEKFRHDAGRGLLLLGDGKGGLEPLRTINSGLDLLDPQTSAQWIGLGPTRGILVLGTAGKNPEINIYSR